MKQPKMTGRDFIYCGLDDENIDDLYNGFRIMAKKALKAQMRKYLKPRLKDFKTALRAAAFEGRKHLATEAHLAALSIHDDYESEVCKQLIDLKNLMSDLVTMYGDENEPI